MSFNVESFDHSFLLLKTITELFELSKNSNHSQSYRIVKFRDLKPNKTKQAYITSTRDEINSYSFARARGHVGVRLSMVTLQNLLNRPLF